MYWKDGSKGKFKIKSVLSIMRNESEFIDEYCWELVRKAPVQQRIRAFMWIACYDRLMGNANKYKRNMTDEPKCFICSAQEETTLHMLRDFPGARATWRRLGGPANSAHFFHSPLKDWFTENLTHEDKEGTPIWASYFGIAIWWIWRWRNNLLFGRREDIPVDIGVFLQVGYDETRRGLDESNDYHKVSSTRRNEIFNC